MLAILTGNKIGAKICRERDLKPEVLSDWKAELLEKAPMLFQSEEQRGLVHNLGGSGSVCAVGIFHLP